MKARPPILLLSISLLSIFLRGPVPGLAQGFDQPASWTDPVEPFRIADQLFYVGSADLTSFLFTSEQGHVLIDAPLEENVELVLDNIRKLGFDPKDVKVQLASHGHFDHTGGMASMLEATGAELILSEPAAELVGSGGRTDFYLSERFAYRPAKAARTIRDGETVTVGGNTLTAHLTPGHTRGCTSWSGTVTIGGETIGGETIDGDPLTFVSICSLSVLDGYRLVGDDETYPGIARDFCSSVEHLSALEPDLFLASHGSFIGLAKKVEALAAGDRRAFVDPERYRAYLARALERIETTLEEQGEPGGCAAVLARR